MNNLEKQIKLSRKTVIEMLTDRNYITKDIISDLPNDLFIKLWAKFTNDATVFDIECENSIGERIYVKYIKTHIISKKKDNIKALKLSKVHTKLCESQDLLFNDKIIYVICDTQYTDIMTTYEDFINKNKNVEIFDIKRLLINITKHSYVPQHIKLSITDVNTLKKNLYLQSIFKLPAISTKDPVARYYNLKHGEVFQIIRPSRSHGVHISYRVCSNIEE